MKNKVTSIVFFVFIFAFSAMCLFLPKSDFSESERRELKAFPSLNLQSVTSGTFAKEFEDYSMDAFPFRDTFRSMKAYASEYLFRLGDNNKIIHENGYLSKIEYPMNKEKLDYAAENFTFIYDKYLKDSNTNVFLSVVPDKSCFLDTLKFDYNEFTTYISEKLPFAEHIDIFSELSLDNYYYTDSHWRQETIRPVADKLASAMGADIAAEYTVNVLAVPFYGVYVGQSALKKAPDTIKYVTNDILSGCIVTAINEYGKTIPLDMYDLEKANGRDPYEFFLSGNRIVLKIENPAAKGGRRLILFRDSFGSSLAPYLVPGYSEITLIDLRHIPKEALSSFVDFENSDVLFIYSTSFLNSPTFNKFGEA